MPGMFWFLQWMKSTCFQLHDIWYLLREADKIWFHSRKKINSVYGVAQSRTRLKRLSSSSSSSTQKGGVYVSILYEWIWSSLGPQDRESKLTYKLKQIITGKRKFPQAWIHGWAKVQGGMEHCLLKLVEREWDINTEKRNTYEKCLESLIG